MSATPGALALAVSPIDNQPPMINDMAHMVPTHAHLLSGPEDRQSPSMDDGSHGLTLRESLTSVMPRSTDPLVRLKARMRARRCAPRRQDDDLGPLPDQGGALTQASVNTASTHTPRTTALGSQVFGAWSSYPVMPPGGWGEWTPAESGWEAPASRDTTPWGKWTPEAWAAWTGQPPESVPVSDWP
ncbi:hypothetical protein C8F04DRAFT_1186925 [Mycena alexandri]|uniref:Uncharacterized protein n=1 Tax=Mycena alexandri TaxID=1745969 RepID=A0AAD6SPV8_9AGAR|nr:hypothetical protein C8F04DRAFT_1186925 [Mycena alexandri]